MNIKRFSIFAGAICASALLALHCTTVEFDNPLDEKSDGFFLNTIDDFPEGYTLEDFLRHVEPNDICQQGGAAYHCDPVVSEIFKCDRKGPTIVLVGSSDVELEWDPSGMNLSGPNTFEMYMGRAGGFNAVARVVKEYDEEPASNITATLSKNGADPLDDWPGHPGMPQNFDTYFIIYTATKLSSCSDGTPNPQSRITRIVRIVPAIEIDIVPPTITLRGNASINWDQFKPFEDPGANATDGRGNAISHTVTGEVDVNTTAVYTLTYTACKTLKYEDKTMKDTCVSVDRRVTVVDTSRPPTNSPFIVLRTYRHDINGGTYNLTDTTSGSTPTQVQFFEPGTTSTDFDRNAAIEKIFYIDNGQEVDITAQAIGSVTRTLPETWRVGQNNINYELPASGDYNRATAVRRVFITERCDAGQPAPTITFEGAANLTIPAGRVWDHGQSWKVTDTDESGRAFQLGIDFGTLRPQWPSAGPYELKYVALGGCGIYSVMTRNVNVE